MAKKVRNFEFIDKEMRKMSFGILSSIDQNGMSHSTGIIYGVAPKTSKFCLYLLTDKNYKKVKNIKVNTSVSFVIPFPHHVLRFVPANCIQFQATAELIPYIDEEAQNVFKNGSKILKMNIDQINKLKGQEDAIFIKIIPHNKLFCYGVGFSMMEIRKNIETGSYSVTIPPEKSF